jgi:hypothetical protein
MALCGKGGQENRIARVIYWQSGQAHEHDNRNAGLRIGLRGRDPKGQPRPVGGAWASGSQPPIGYSAVPQHEDRLYVHGIAS